MEAVRDRMEGWKKDNGLVTWKECIYVPFNPNLRSEIMKLNHDHPLARHLGWDKTKELIGQGYWWLQIYIDILKCVEECDTCQRVNTNHMKASNPLNLTLANHLC